MGDDRFGALVPGLPLDLPGARTGRLVGRRAVVKDVFDVAGQPTGAGNPSRRAAATPATTTAQAVLRLLAAGAHVVGRSRTDELAYSLSGQNEVDGSPENPVAPGHLAGGSSSGSAVAVASGMADVGLGTDTGGSIRVPASHCGLYGLRPTHGRVPASGLVPLAPSFDTVGWLTATGPTCADVGPVLLDGWDARRALPPRRLLVLDDVLARSPVRVLEGASVTMAARLGASLGHATLGRGDDLDRWWDAYRVLQGREAWGVHGRWITEAQPVLGAAVRERFEAAAQLTDDEVATARAAQAGLRARLAALLADGTALVVPAAAGPPLALDADAATVDAFRRATLTITCLAPLAGLPASASPIHTDGLPMGLSLIGRANDDEALLAALRRLGASA